MNINIRVNELNRGEDGLAQLIASVPALGLQYNLDLPFGELHARCGIPDETNLDFLLIASLVYVIDKIVPRSSAFDVWTRELEMELPVSEPSKWQKVAKDLNETLGFLTGDIWQLSFRQRSENLFQRPAPKRRRKPSLPRLSEINAVCSFSGGVDSLIGAIDLLENDAINEVRLIGHYDAPGAKKSQQTLFDALSRSYPDKAELLQVRVSHKPFKANEPTLRSRSFVFIALGLYAARAAGEQTPLYMPENGFIALNVPLTPARAGSCSTRTMHPYYLMRLADVLIKVGINNPIVNSLEFKTKGECVAECSNIDLLNPLVQESVSCSHASRKQHWIRRTSDVKNCGYCVPCLIRRASLYKSDLDAPARYGIDVCAGEINYYDKTSSANDFRAVINVLTSNKTARDFEKDILAVAPVTNLEQRAQMIERGFAEIKNFIRANSGKAVLQAVGLTSIRND